MSLQLIDRFHPRLRSQQQAVIDAGGLRKCDELELLESEQLRSLANFSFLLLVIGGVFFVGLDLLAYLWQRPAHPGLTFGTILLWLLLNVLGYLVVLPIHEAIHGLAFAFWGGKPYFGTKLPLALYCGAKNQVFRRNHYLVVGLAPLVVITLAGIILTLLAPVPAAYLLLATAGNFSGAAGDLIVARRLGRQSEQILVEDTEAGYRAWALESPG